MCDLSRVNVEKEARMCVVLCWVGWDDGWRRGEATREYITRLGIGESDILLPPFWKQKIATMVPIRNLGVE